MFRLALTFLAFFVSSCSVINVSTDNKVHTYRKFGFVNLVQLPNSGAYTDTNFFGIGLSDSDFIVGYKGSKKLVLSDHKCAVFISKESKIDNSVLQYLKEINCNFIYLQGDKDND